MSSKTITLTSTVKHGTDIVVHDDELVVGEWLRSTGQIKVYTDSAMTTEVTSLKPETSYYVWVETNYYLIYRSDLEFTLETPHSATTVTPLGNGEFFVEVALVKSNETDIILNATTKLAGDTELLEEITRTLTSPASTFVKTCAVNVYSDSELTTEVTDVIEYGTYYVKVSATVHSLADINQVVYDLSTDQTTEVTITELVGDGVYQVDLTMPTSPLQFTGTADYMDGTTVICSKSATIDPVVRSFINEPATVKFYTDSSMTTKVDTLDSNTTYFARILLDYPTLDRGELTFSLSTTHSVVSVSPLGDGNFDVVVGLVPPDDITANFSGTTSLTSDGTLLESFTRDMTLNVADSYIASGTLSVYSDSGLTTEVTSMIEYGTYYAKLTGVVEDGADPTHLTYQLVTDAGAAVNVVDLEESGVYRLELTEPTSPVTLTGTIDYVVDGVSYDTKVLDVPVTISSFINQSATVKFYTDSSMTTEVGSFDSETTYFARIVKDYKTFDRDELAFELTTNHTRVTVTPLGDGNFDVVVGLIREGEESVTFDGNVKIASDNTLLESFSRTVQGEVFEDYLTDAWINVYSDSGLTNEVSEIQGTTIEGEELTYYVKVSTTTHSSVDDTDLSYSISSTLGDEIEWTYLGDGLYAMKVGDTGDVDSTMTIYSTVQYYDGTTLLDEIDTSLTINTIASTVDDGILVGVMGGDSHERFYAVTTDSNDNIICAGYTRSEGPGDYYRYSCLVVKFDSTLTILARKVMGGDGGDYFNAVTTDSNNNIICAGYVHSEGPGESSCLVVKFDSTLTILARRVMGGSSHDRFHAVTTDSSNNIICAGFTYSEGPGSGSCLVVKFDSILVSRSPRVMGGVEFEEFLAVTTDSSNNIICAGRTFSEGPGDNSRCLVVKFDNTLTILARRVMGGSSSDRFYAVTTDSSNNIICAGYTRSEGPGDGWRCLVVKFDSSLVSRSPRVMGGDGRDEFRAVTTDSSNNIICVGYTDSEGPGGNSCLVVKFDSTLTILARKVMGGWTGDYSFGVTTDSSNNIICVGLTYSDGPGSYSRCLVAKFPEDIPSGTFTGTVLTGLSIEDSALAMEDSTLAMEDSTLAMEDSTLAMEDSTLPMENSTLDYILDDTFE